MADAAPPVDAGEAADGGDGGPSCGEDVECDDGDPCTADRCAEGVCARDRLPVALRPRAVFTVDGEARDVAVVNGFVYVAAGAAGWTRWTFDEGGAPALDATFEAAGPVARVVPSEPADYAVVEGVGVQTFNGVDRAPATPWAAAGDVQSAVFVRGRLLALATFSKGVEVVRFADPEAPEPLARADTPGRALDLAIGGDRLWVADGLAGLAVFTFGNVQKPELQDGLRVATDGRAVAVAASRDGTRVLLAELGAGLGVLDVAPGEPPRRTATLLFGAPVLDVALLGPATGLVAAETAGVVALDLIDVQSPQIAAQVELPGPALAVAREGEIVAVAMGAAGVQLLELPCGAAPAPEPDAGL